MLQLSRLRVIRCLCLAAVTIKPTRDPWLANYKKNTAKKYMSWLVGLEFNSPVNTLKVISSWLVYLTTLGPLRG